MSFEMVLIYRCPMEHTTARPKVDNPEQSVPCGICRPVINVQRGRGQEPSSDGIARLVGERRVKKQRTGIAATAGGGREFIE